MRLLRGTILALIALLLSHPLAGENNPLCLCQFVAPTYPPFARQIHTEGTIEIAVTYDSAGKPATINPLTPEPFTKTAPLRKAAIDSVSHWRFCPTPGESDRNEVIVTFRFKLRDIQPAETDHWSPTEVSFEPPAIVNITTTAFTEREY